MDCIVIPSKGLASEEYETLIAQFLERELQTKPHSKESLLESLTTFFIGTKDTRYGRIPAIEVLSTVREYLRTQIEAHEPITVLVPWGGKKPLGGSVDVAELSALRMLQSLSNTVKAVYEPGLDIVIRVEDLGAEWLYKNGHNEELGDEVLYKEIERYSSDVSTLIKMFGMTPRSEYNMMCRSEYIKRASILVPHFVAYLVESDVKGISAGLKTFEPLVEAGWKGVIPQEQRDYYRGRYKELYGVSDATATMYLAKYFAGSLVRHKMHGIGTTKPHVQVTFASPIPGVPSTMFKNTFFMRTIPASHGRTHIAPWRAKGYIAIQHGDVPVFKIASPSTLPPMYEASVVMKDSRYGEVTVKADYTLE
jgi:hypothetical protein